MTNLGIDIGASAVKLAAARDGKLIFKRYINGHPDILEAMESSGIDPRRLHRIALTGLGSTGVDTKKLIARCELVDEFRAAGTGARVLSGRDRLIAASVGTGTAYISVDGDKIAHIGGTGVGGGTLCGLGSLLGFDSAETLLRAAMDGSLANVDLSIGDIQPGSDFLDPRITAANLAKISPEATKNDWAAGITNLILQVVGSMALFAAKTADVSSIVMTGALVTSEAAQINFHNFQKIYGIEFLIPPHAECATAFGAALLV